jgi:mannose-1-phosphate guanylyltransferase/mannose-6-phosphate isomerase
MLHPVILSGGSGTRLWPLSRRAQPKQFLRLTSDRSLFQETALRAAAIEGARAPLLVCSREHGETAAEQLRDAGVPAGRILLEPVGRNTAPAIASAALALAEDDAQALLLVLPSDHVVRDGARFARGVALAAQAARAGRIVTFGIVPSGPETGYGYVGKGGALAGLQGVHEIERFVEKPPAEAAREFASSGRYLWNSGIFVFRADVLLAELERFAPDILTACRSALANARAKAGVLLLDESAFAACRSSSVDYALMEFTGRGAVLELDMGWSDVGTWSALWKESGKDGDGNSVGGDVYLDAVRDCLVKSEHRAVAAVGVKDLVIVETADAVLVAGKDSCQRVKEAARTLGTGGGLALRRRVERPWGHFESIEAGERYQVKRLTIAPGGRLSLQLHRQRSEHWVIVRGNALVTRGPYTLTLTENQSIFIPRGTKHRLENPHEALLEVIEVQIGDYLGEDDIERFEDAYQRA